MTQPATVLLRVGSRDTFCTLFARQHRFATRQDEATARFAFAKCAQFGHSWLLGPVSTAAMVIGTHWSAAMIERYRLVVCCHNSKIKGHT
jgi:hypothetical protein